MKSKSPAKVPPCYLNEDKLRIIIRMRPILNQEDENQFIELEDDNTLQIKRPGNLTFMKFNNILDPSSTQKDVFNQVEDSIRQFLNGINMTIFAYGQTGAGKTYSMIGNYSPKDSQQNLFNFLSSKQRGILSRSLEMIMSFINKREGNKINVAFYEIYNEKIFDLYNNTMVPLDIRESKNGQISIPDLLQVEVSNMQEAIQYLMIGLKNRATGSTHGNAQSSRSHSIFQINLEKEEQNGNMICSTLRIVDLAGSEKFKIASDLSPAEKQIRIQELTSINGSLSCLGHCISALIQKSRTHIPFRNSKLTRILSDSLLGQGKMRFVICISPSLSASAQSFSTLQFANRAKKAIFERADLRTPNLSKKRSSENEQITLLKRQIEKQREMRVNLQKQLSSIMTDRSQDVIKQNVYLRKQNQKLKHQLKQLMLKNSQINKSPQSSSRLHEDFAINFQNRDNLGASDLKSEMLKLPIFQNKRSQQVLQTQFQDPCNYSGMKNRIGQPLVQREIKDNNTQINKKKAQFQKKIRRFIESDSPPKRPSLSKSYINKSNKEVKENNQQYSQVNKGHNYGYFRQKEVQNVRKSGITIPSHLSSMWAQNQQNEESNDTFNNQDNLRSFKKLNGSDANNSHDECEWIDNEDTQQLIEQACEQMNLPDFKDLRSQMDRAKQELILLKQKDDEISRRKIGVTKNR